MLFLAIKKEKVTDFLVNLKIIFDFINCKIIQIKNKTYQSLAKKLERRLKFIQNLNSFSSKDSNRIEIDGNDFEKTVNSFKLFKNNCNIEFPVIFCCPLVYFDLRAILSHLNNQFNVENPLIQFSANNFEGLVDGAIFFKKSFSSLYSIPKLSLNFDLHQVQQSLNEESVRYLLEKELIDKLGDEPVHLIIFSGFSVNSNFHLLTLLIMQMAGIRILKAFPVESGEQVPLVFDSFLENQELFQMICKFYEKEPCFVILYRLDPQNEQFQNSFVQNLFNFDSNLTFQSTIRIFETKSNLLVSSFEKIITAKESVARILVSSNSVFDICENLKHEYFKLKNTNQISLLESYKKYVAHSFLSKCFGLLYINKSLESNQSDLFQKTRPFYIIIKPQMVEFKDALVYFLKKLKLNNQL